MEKSVLLLVEDADGVERLVSRATTPWLRLMARLLGSSLDRELATGTPAESRRLLAARADMLASPTTREALARNWRDLLERAFRSQTGRLPRVPICRDRIIDAEAHIQAMLSALTASRPSSARGVAMASRLLSDGAGPLYNRHSATDLRVPLREVLAQLDSTHRLVESA
ncbi:MAG: hypothetical protein ACLP6E_09295 [Acidimicrobiales bacterium]